MRQPIDGAHLSDVKSVLDSIRRIVRVLRITDRLTAKHFGLSTAQLFVLQRLARLLEDPVAATGMAQEFPAMLMEDDGPSAPTRASKP